MLATHGVGEGICPVPGKTQELQASKNREGEVSRARSKDSWVCGELIGTSKSSQQINPVEVR